VKISFFFDLYLQNILLKMPVLDLNQPVPSFILKKQNIVKLIVYTSLFALLFINIYSPFGVTLWFTIDKWQLLLYSSMIILTGVFVVVISRIIMYNLYKNKPLKYWQYFIWVAAEIFFMALFYVLFEIIFLKDKRNFIYLLKVSMQNTALVLLLPYAVLWLYFSYQEKKEMIEKLEDNPKPKNSNDNILIPFHDEKGILRISIKQNNFLYLEANDNYVNLYYLVDGKIESFLLRNSLKKIESELINFDIIRCHRSYIVNFSKVRMIYKNSNGLTIELDVPERIQIPISRNYSENILKKFLQFQDAK
jgi:DNA-binding LytR/AlgR family response regulator